MLGWADRRHGTTATGCLLRVTGHGDIDFHDLIAALAPRWCEAETRFKARGGIGITVRAEHGSAPSLAEE